MKVRQVALVANDLAMVRSQLFTLLGLSDDFADPGVSSFGLENSVMTIGDTFLEVVSPVAENTTAGRLLERRGGDSGYMVISQVRNLDAVSNRLDQLGVRKVWEIEIAGAAKAFHLHPKDVPGAICSFDEMTPPESWKWAGPGWEKRGAKYVASIVGVEMQFEDPEHSATKWSRVFDRPISVRDEASVIALDDGEIRFVDATDGRGDCLRGVDFATNDWSAIAAAADRLDLPRHEHAVDVCGTRFQFV